MIWNDYMTGFICLDKSEGITSFVAASKVRRICEIKKAGHTGTLDPMATGVLPIMLGGATRFSDFLPKSDKAYEADILLGTATDSYDITGSVTKKAAVCVSDCEFKEALSHFTGEIKQLPPMYSAVSQDGVRLYKLARQGIEVERKERDITVYSAELINRNENIFTVSFTCSAGTYIRSLANDIGEYLGCGGCLTRLRRTVSNGFTIENSYTFDELLKLKENGELEKAVIKTDDILSCYKKVTVTAAQASRFRNGGALSLDRIKNIEGCGIFRVYNPENRFIGLGRTDEEKNELAVAKLLIE